MAPAPRVLLVTGIYPPDIGGPARHIRVLSEYLCSAGWGVDVTTLGAESNVYPEDWGARVYSIARRPLSSRLVALTRTMLSLSRGADVIYANGLNVEAFMASRAVRRPICIKVVGDYSWERAVRLGWFDGTIAEYAERRDELGFRLLNSIRDLPLRGAEAVITPSRYLAGLVSNWGRRDDVEVIPNGVEAGKGDDAGQADGTRNTDFLFVGRLVQWKGVAEVLHALEGIPSSTLRIVGEGPIRKELEALALSLGVDDRVRFLGSLSADRVRMEMLRAKTLVLYSNYEGLPHVVLEAWRCGMAVVASAAGGTPEVVLNEKSGLLVPLGSVVELRLAMDRTRVDYRLRERLASGGKDVVDAIGTESAMCARVEAVLTRLASGSALSP